MTAPITLTESRQLIELEAKIEAGRKTFVEVGLALAEIRDKELYRSDFSTFEEYCREKWGWEKRYWQYVIASSETVRTLPESSRTIVHTESQARELSKVSPAKREEVVTKAQSVAQAENRTMTAKDVANAAKPLSFCKQCQTSYPAANGHVCDVVPPRTLDAEWTAAIGGESVVEEFKSTQLPPEHFEAELDELLKRASLQDKPTRTRVILKMSICIQELRKI